MIILRKLNDLNKIISRQKKHHYSIGFVPTMGALHEGHISLVEESAKENDFTIVSIFVNPTQFNNAVDLEKYPRIEDIDIQILSQSDADAVFFPKTEDIYPHGQKAEKFDFNGLENQMEGKFRPGHFDGVATVVKKFFEIVQPNRAYFGEKDFQQLRIIQELVKIFHLPVEIVPVPIMRESGGLAMSSRNMRLTKEMRQESPKIYQILKKAKFFLEDHSVAETKQFVADEFSETRLDLEYFEIADEKTLKPVTDKSKPGHIRAFVAAFAGDVRLIDNLKFK